MDISRPDLKRKKRRKKVVWVGLPIAVALVFLVIWLFKKPHHHRESVTLNQGDRAIQALVVFPDVRDKASSVVVLVHEVYGLSDWARQMAEELADEGFIVVAPDLLSGYGPNGGGFSAFASEAERVSAVSGLDPTGVLTDLDAAVDFGKSLPQANGKVAVVGFSWGGWKSFAFAAHRRDLSAVCVFYGTGPDDVAAITAPVYGFYAGKDGAVSGSVPGTADQMKAAGRFYDPVIYDGAEHGFMRLGDGLMSGNHANKRARDQAFARLIEVLGQMGKVSRP